MICSFLLSVHIKMEINENMFVYLDHQIHDQVDVNVDVQQVDQSKKYLFILNTVEIILT